MINPTMGAREWGLLILLSGLWGGSFFFVEIALAEMSPLLVAEGRVAFAALALLVFVHIRGYRLPTTVRAWGAFLVMGGLNNALPFALIAWGQSHIDSAPAAILNATTPLFTMILAHWVTRDERMTPAKITGLLFGIGGVAMLFGPRALDTLGMREMGQLAVLGAALCYASAALYGRHRLRGMPPSVAAAGMTLAASVLLLPVVLATEPLSAVRFGATTWGAVLGLALLCTAMAYPLYFRILATAGATNLLLVTFLIPVSALLLGIFLLGERPGWNAYGGMALILTGLAAIDGRLLMRLRSWKSA